MATNVVETRAEDLLPVGSRISWGAILGGAFVALAVYFMCAVLGAAVGLSIRNRVELDTLRTSAIIWNIVTLAIALFVGGMVTSQFTTGENRVEAVTYGIIMWAFLVTVLLVHAAAGARTGLMALAHADAAQGVSWQQAARDAGVSQQQIDAWRHNAVASDQATAQAQNQESGRDLARTMAWFLFGGTWLSMFAAAGGAFLGAGPAFRVVAFGTRLP